MAAAAWDGHTPVALVRSRALATQMGIPDSVVAAWSFSRMAASQAAASPQVLCRNDSRRSASLAQEARGESWASSFR